MLNSVQKLTLKTGIVVTVFLSTHLFANATLGGRRIATLYICNSNTKSYCKQTPAYGQGYGMIILEENGVKKNYPVLPWGQTMDQTSKVAEDLKRFRENESQKQSAKPFLYTQKFMASGFVGIDPISKQHSVFFLTSMD